MITELNHTSAREKQIEQIYQRAFPAVAAFVKKKNGSLDEAKDIFQDALIILFEKKQSGKLVLQQTESAYLVGIARHLWYKNHRYSKQNCRWDDETELSHQESGEFNVSEKLMLFVEQSGKKCMELLSSFYYEQLTMKQIATRFGFSGERSATAQKFKCLEKVRNAIHQRSLSKEDFYA